MSRRTLIILALVAAAAWAVWKFVPVWVLLLGLAVAAAALWYFRAAVLARFQRPVDPDLPRPPDRVPPDGA